MSYVAWGLRKLGHATRSAGQAGRIVLFAAGFCAACGSSERAASTCWVDLDSTATSAAQRATFTSLGEPPFDASAVTAAVDWSPGTGPALFRVYPPSGKAAC